MHKSTKLKVQVGVVEDVLLDLEFRGAEVHQESVFNPRSPQVAEKLCNMLFSHIPDGLHLHDEAILHEQVSIEVAEQRPIFAENLQRMLLLHLEPLLPETVNERVLINLLQVAIPMVAMKSKPCFANHIAKLHDILQKVPPSFPFVLPVPFRG